MDRIGGLSGRAEIEATYRFFDNEKVTFDKLLQPHVQSTLKRVAVEKTVLLVQDTTEIDLTRPSQEVEGAGALDDTRRGILLHEMQAFTAQGVPLGTLWAQTINRTELKHSAAKKRSERKATPIEEKESLRWHVDRILPHLAVCLIVGWHTMFVCHMARECPDLCCEAIFEPSEWKAVWVAVNRKKAPEKAPRLQAMVHLIAELGSYVERANNRPDPQTIWIGLQRMYDLAWAWDAFGPEAKLRT